MFVATVALNQAVLFTTLQHRYVLPLVMFRIGPCEFTLVNSTASEVTTKGGIEMRLLLLL